MFLQLVTSLPITAWQRLTLEPSRKKLWRTRECSSFSAIPIKPVRIHTAYKALIFARLSPSIASLPSSPDYTEQTCCRSTPKSRFRLTYRHERVARLPEYGSFVLDLLETIDTAPTLNSSLCCSFFNDAPHIISKRKSCLLI